MDNTFAGRRCAGCHGDRNQDRRGFSRSAARPRRSGSLGAARSPMCKRSTTRAASTGARSTISRSTMPIVRRKRSSMSEGWSKATRSRSCSASSEPPAIQRSRSISRRRACRRSRSSPAPASSPSAKDYPLTTTGLVSYDTEGKIYAKYLSRSLPTARYAILFQNDDLGKDYVNAFKDISRRRLRQARGHGCL